MNRLDTSKTQGFVSVPVTWLNQLMDEVKRVADAMEGQEKKPVYLTARQIIERYNISRTTLYRLKEEGRIEYVKVGKRYKYRIEPFGVIG